MEEQILKILGKETTVTGYNKYGNAIWSKKEPAKEITAHVMEFIEWLRNETVLELIGNDWRWILPAIQNDDIDKHFTSNEEAYQYWLTNVKQ